LRSDVQEIYEAIRDVPDFPKPGIIFKDITPLLLDPARFRRAVELMAAPFRASGVRRVVSIESRGFLLGAPIALLLEAGLVPIRKPGKLPAARGRVEYALEYGTDALEMHRDAVGDGDRVLIVDDVLATGGTAEAAAKLVRAHGAAVAGFTFLIELDFLKGRARLRNERVEALLHYA
jgi:adenine phosphoribosyltransferase